MIKYNPSSFQELIINNKKELIEFIDERFSSNDLNMTICGNHNSNKSKICKLIIERFLNENKHVEKNKILFTYNSYDDINLQTQNVMSIFCQNNINSNKLIYIENFDELTDSTQQQIKIYMDKYNVFKENYKIYFLIKTNNEYNLKDIIRSRTNVFHLTSFTTKEYNKILNLLLEKNKIELNNECIQYILNIQNISINFINTIIVKLLLLDNKPYTLNLIKTITTIIDYNDFDKYITFLQEEKYKEACDIFYKLYIDGYDLSDIYFYFYNYLKDKIENQNKDKSFYYDIIEKLCFYINEIYNGNFDKFMINLLSFEIYEIINPDKDNSSILV